MFAISFSRTAIAFAAAGGLAIAALSAIGGSAMAEDKAVKPTPKCLDIHYTGRFHVVDDHTLLVYDTWGNPYQLDIGGPCRSMTDFSHFGFEVNGTSQVCQAHDAMLLYSQDTERPVRCLINGVKPLTKAEALVLDPDPKKKK